MEAEIESFSKTEKQKAASLNKEVKSLLAEIKQQESGLASNFARLGVLLLEVRAKKYWLLWDYQSFGQYIESIREQVDKGRTQLYVCISIAEKLLPVVNETQITTMGISRAKELKKAIAVTGKKPSEGLVAKALDPTIKLDQLRADIAEEFHIHDHNEKGKWFDFGGFYLTDDERAELLQAMDAAKLTDPVIRHDMPEHCQRKEIILRFAREYFSTYGALAGRGEA